jgi:HlyD family secretion protein
MTTRQWLGCGAGTGVAPHAHFARLGLGVLVAGAIAGIGCSKPPEALLYEKVAVTRRNLSVSVSAAGAIEPVRTVDVKSKASGEIIEMHVETGDEVRAGQLLARIDPRVQRNALAQAQANLDVAQARLQNAEAQKRRADELFARQSIAETEHEATNLAFATARAEVVGAQTALESARDQMEDTAVKAASAGTILQKSAELGTVISSPTKDVGGGSVLFRMADLDTMQVRALVDETDIGKVQAGPDASVRVDAYPNRTFRGRVVKIEPQAVVQQNVTLFPVIIAIDNPGHLLRPGMNSEVELDVGSRTDVLTVPNAALRTERDVTSAAQVLGLDADDVQAQLAAGRMAGQPAEPAAAPDSAGMTRAARAGGDERTLLLPNGRQVQLPDGVSAADVRAAMQKRMAGSELSEAESALLRRVFAGRGGRGDGGGGRGGFRGSGGRRASAFGGRYIVFTLRNGAPAPVEIETGLTDLDYIEVVRGLSAGDTVLVLPSASLVNAQREFRERMQQRTGGGGLPGMQRSGGTTGSGSGGAGGTSGDRRSQGR